MHGGADERWCGGAGCKAERGHGGADERVPALLPPGRGGMGRTAERGAGASGRGRAAERGRAGWHGHCGTTGCRREQSSHLDSKKFYKIF